MEHGVPGWKQRNTKLPCSDEILGIRYNLASWAAQQFYNRCKMNYCLKDIFCLDYRKILLVLFQFCNYLLSLLAG